MASGGRRQDVVFLALAVSVLAIAVALFVVMRSIPKDKAEPTEEVQVEPAEEPAEPSEPEPAATRDPFKSQQTGGASPTTRAGHELRLAGITHQEGKPTRALIYRGSRRYNVRVGDRLGGYRVVSIGQSRVELEGESGQLTLLWRQPQEEEEGW